MGNDICYVCGTHNMRGSVCLTCCPNGDPRLEPANTRPAAPVEGLETKGYMRPEDRDQLSFWVSKNQNAYYWEPIVTRSQAEAIIAAKDRLLSASDTVAQQLQNQIVTLTLKSEDLEADNAAKDHALKTHLNRLSNALGRLSWFDDTGEFRSNDQMFDFLVEQAAEERNKISALEDDNAALTARVKAVPYHLSEIEGCLKEYIAMPCSSLRARLLGAIATARAILEAKP